jgi:hypothetical protein
VPIRLLFSERKREPLEEVKRRGRSRPPTRDDD